MIFSPINFGLEAYHDEIENKFFDGLLESNDILEVWSFNMMQNNSLNSKKLPFFCTFSGLALFIEAFPWDFVLWCQILHSAYLYIGLLQL